MAAVTKGLALEQQKTRRLVKVRKRKAVSGHSSVLSVSNKENTPPEVKKSKKEPETRLPLCPEDGVDWGLKTKARFVSTHSFDWANVKRAKQESQGLASFIQGAPDSQEPVCELQTLLHYWEHPSLPSLSLFTEERHRVAISTPLRDAAFTDSLKEDWSTSFHSLFQLFRLGTCSHFYLCASDLTILFVTTDPGEPCALISPSTSGFRRALGREGVEFSMPLNSAQPVAETSLDNESDDECSSWIDSVIGAEKKAVIKTTIQQRQSVDSRPESTLLVPTSSLQSLFNYLLNCKTLVSTSGTLAGVPPTLVAPSAFQGATLRTLKVLVGSLSEQKESGLIKRHYVDIVGPLLPHTMRTLRTLLDRTQQDHPLTVHTVEHRHSSAFTNIIRQDSS